jgi:hypothetical protein
MSLTASPTALEAGIISSRPACQPPASSLGWPATHTNTDTHTPREAAAALPVHYQHCDNRLGVDFLVQRLPFEGLQALDPRQIRIPPPISPSPRPAPAAHGEWFRRRQRQPSEQTPVLTPPDPQA